MENDDLRPRGAALRMAGYLGRIATGPELSKDLTEDEARDAMTLVLRGEVDPVQAAVFLIALRMKRESHAELCGVLAALRDSAARAVAPVDDLVDMAEPYNGYLRHLPAAPFMPAVLAACGVPCVLHGCRASGPKWGVTAHRILAAAGARVDLGSDQAAARVGQVGWAYVDLARFCAPLAGLARLRSLIVKRPCLSLLEKLVAPVRARGRTHLWVGYAHRAYPEILRDLARDFDYASMLAVRGVEGGVLTSLTGRVRGERSWGEGALEPVTIDAFEALDTTRAERAPALPPEPAASPDESGDESGQPDAHAGRPDTAMVERWAARAAEAGREALAGRPGPTADMLILGAAAMLRHLGRTPDLAAGAAMARRALQDGTARERFEA